MVAKNRSKGGMWTRVLSGLALFVVASIISARPDPDIFDGRRPVEPPPPVPSEAAPPTDEPSSGAGELPDAGIAQTPDESGGAASAEATEAADGQDGGGEEAVTAEGGAENAGEADAESGGADSKASSERSFEGLDAIGGVPVDHPGAPSLPDAPTQEGGDPEESAVAETSAAGPGTAEARGTVGTGDEAGGASREPRTFDGLDVGGSEARGQQVEINRSIELRPPLPSPTVPRTPEAGGGSSPNDRREDAETGTEVPQGL